MRDPNLGIIMQYTLVTVYFSVSWVDSIPMQNWSTYVADVMYTRLSAAT